MSFSARHPATTLLLLLSVAVTLYAQSTAKQTSKAPRGTVSGRVTIKDKGAAGVAISLRKSEMVPYDSVLRATTDQEGFYRITNVPAGSYEVAPSTPAFVNANKNQHPRGAQPVVVGEDENVDGINFSLVRGGVITGKVTDAEGRPVIQQQVYLFQAEVFDQRTSQRQVFASGGAQTDDRGIYRAYGLTAGRYKVASGRSDEIFSGSYMPNRAIYKQVFHPDVTDQAKATIIEVSEGSEANNVDIKLGVTLQTFSVSGRVIDGETGLAVPNLHFGVQRMVGQRPDYMNTTLISNAQGDFFGEGFIPGTYKINLFQNQNSEMRAESLNFEIVDQDVTDVVIKLTKGATLSGVVVLENDDKVLFQKLLQMQLQAFVAAQPPATSSSAGSAYSAIAPDGSFRMAGLPGGTANLMLGSIMRPMDAKGFSISRVERDGVVMPRGVEVKDKEHVARLRVVVAYGNATLRGVVKLENGTIPSTARVFIRLTRTGDNPSGFRPPPVDARGHFLMEGLPPGTYEIYAHVPGVGPPGRSVKREVSLQDGVVTDVVLTIDLSSPPKP